MITITVPTKVCEEKITELWKHRFVRCKRKSPPGTLWTSEEGVNVS
jgi:hypothetical protein